MFPFWINDLPEKSPPGGVVGTAVASGKDIETTATTRQAVKSDRIKRQMAANAATINSLRARIDETCRSRNASVEHHARWLAAAADFHRRYDELSFPGGGENLAERIAEGERETVENVLCFLECRPYFFRSGYMYQWFVRKIRRAPLEAAERRRLEAVLERLTAWRAIRAGRR